MAVSKAIPLEEIIWIDPERMSGIACFAGTRVPVQALMDHLEGGSTLDDFLEGFPSVKREQAVAFLELAKVSTPIKPNFQARRKAIWGDRVFRTAEVEVMREEENNC